MLNNRPGKKDCVIFLFILIEYSIISSSLVIYTFTTNNYNREREKARERKRKKEREIIKRIIEEKHV